ncbi:uncharacterized protein TRIREDRAFT_53824 [Trichoderma reesei QM6a]|uniref:Predicted protein n=2 Tax=Hypocrea jecorina TaxID=51453 RepID=G0R8W9_HYPJQ|nr:uncharacterized protein TRIREDRAFT_53824 [Trichoderma reesei QM6a]EGR52961.1 predicted protein [Trichoderma reesei QM6a]ETS06833.1 hypothetical protein M419DRAFT_126263 [Trichoderma reesei RUT C-30]
MAREHHLRRLLSSISDDSDDEEGSLPQHTSKEKPTEKPHALRLLVKPCSFLLVLLTTCVISFWAGLRAHDRQANVDILCAKHTNRWSPLVRDVPIKYTYQEFNGSFLKENIYRNVGSAEVDKAWEDLGSGYRAGVISYKDGIASGLDPSFVQRAEKYGGGFIVNVEGMHHLHCLNLVRKALYFNYDYYKELGEHAFVNEEFILRLHITHCLDTLRQVLMCNVDTGVLGQVWVDTKEPTAFPVFSTKHVCKNYDDIRKWAELQQAPPPDKLPKDYLAPPKAGDVFESTP